MTVTSEKLRPSFQLEDITVGPVRHGYLYLCIGVVCRTRPSDWGINASGTNYSNDRLNYTLRTTNLVRLLLVFSFRKKSFQEDDVAYRIRRDWWALGDLEQEEQFQLVDRNWKYADPASEEVYPNRSINQNHPAELRRRGAGARPGSDAQCGYRQTIITALTVPVRNTGCSIHCGYQLT